VAFLKLQVDCVAHGYQHEQAICHQQIDGDVAHNVISGQLGRRDHG